VHGLLGLKSECVMDAKAQRAARSPQQRVASAINLPLRELPGSGSHLGAMH